MANRVDGGWQELYTKRERYLKTFCVEFLDVINTILARL